MAQGTQETVILTFSELLMKVYNDQNIGQRHNKIKVFPFPARVYQDQVKLLISSTDDVTTFFAPRVKLIGNQKNLEQGACVFVNLNEEQIVSVLETGKLLGNCSLNTVINNQEYSSFDELVSAINILKDTFSYKSLVEKRKISSDEFKTYDELILKLSFLIGDAIDQKYFTYLWITRQQILNFSPENIKKLQEEYIAKKANLIKEFNDQEKELKIKKEGLENAINENKHELTQLENDSQSIVKFLNEHQWVKQFKLIVENEQTGVAKNIVKITKNNFEKIIQQLKFQQNISQDFAECYLLSVLTSLINGRFLLLTGHIGTGKSKIIKDTAPLLGGETDMIAVRPAWLDATDLLGYFDPVNNRYHKTDFVDYLQKPNNDLIHMILLDEMNIARIENYGADILANLSSIYERKNLDSKIRLYSETLNEQIAIHALYHQLDSEKQTQFKHLLLPFEHSTLSIQQNVLICGTLNIDGSTENLSPKMLDRSFLLKFPDFDGKISKLDENADQQSREESFNISIKELAQLVAQYEHKKYENDEIENWNNFYEHYVENIKELLIPISRRVVHDYMIYKYLAKKVGFTKNSQDKVDGYFFYARILTRLECEQFTEEYKNKLSEIMDKIILCEPFKEEIEKKLDRYLSYQQICG